MFAVLREVTRAKGLNQCPLGPFKPPRMWRNPEILFWSNQEYIVNGCHQFVAVLRPVLPLLSDQLFHKKRS